jgi:hypothetical protein
MAFPHKKVFTARFRLRDAPKRQFGATVVAGGAENAEIFVF